MTSVSKMSTMTKNRVKSFVDITFIVFVMLVTFGAAFFQKISHREALIISAFLFLYAVQYFILKKWVEKSFFQSINTQSEATSKTTHKILELSNKQKEEINTHIQLVVSAINVAQSLKTEIDTTMEKAQKVSSKANQSLDFSQKEQISIKASIEKMAILKQKIQIIAGLILDLSERTQQIGETIYLIEDIAEQTNMLALNAAVEAARAGENGKGFSIVAGEIRKLADESKQATTKITSLIKNIQQATNSTVMATEEGAKEIELGVELADNINRNVDSLINIINEVKNETENIYADSKSQTSSSKNLNEVMNEVGEGLKLSLKTLEEKIEDVHSIGKISDSFKDTIG